MEVNSGAAVCIISEQTQKKLFPKTLLQQTSIKLRTYTDEAVPVLGEMAVSLQKEKPFALGVPVQGCGVPSLPTQRPHCDSMPFEGRAG